MWFGLLPVRSPLLRESSLFLGVREMFQFPRFPPARTQVPGITQGGCPIRTSPDRRLPAPPQSISSRGHVLHRPVAPRHPPCAHLWIILFIGSWPSSRLPRIMVFVVRAMTSVITRVLAPLSGGASSVCNVHQSWWSRGDSNPGPPPCKGGALPTKLRPQIPVGRHTHWWARLDSNQGPRPYQGRALTT